jgi:DNA-directed RNA polymerase specialized sigma subunit
MIPRRRLTPAQERLAWRAFKHHGSAVARDALTMHHVGLAHMLAMKVRAAHLGLSGDDILGFAYLYLLEAIDRFDPSLGYAFSTYAIARIKRRLMHAVRSATPLSAGKQEARVRLDRAQDMLRNDLFRDPTEEELAAACGMSQEAVALVMRPTNLHPIPLSQSPYAELADDYVEMTPFRMAESDLFDDPCAIACRRDVRRDMLSRLQCRQREVVETMVRDDDWGASALGVTSGCVYEARLKAVRRLRAVPDIFGQN